MPVLVIHSNADLETGYESELLKAASKTVSEMLSKPESYVMVSFQLNPHMLFAGSSQFLAYLELKSINLDRNQTAEYSSKLCALMNQYLGIPMDRVYIEFSDAERPMFGWNGATF